MDGVLVVDKPGGRTSFDVVRDVRSLLRIKKVGHTGTLDPMATGLLPLCLGDATRVAGYITEGDKTYDAGIQLGQETDTQDAEGKVVREAPVPVLTAEIIEAALAGLRGPSMQTPPMYSAVKINGKRLYEHARAGEEVEREARPVVVHALVLRDFSADEIRVSVKCSKGFFVRTLAEDLGRALGSAAHLKALRRTASGPFTLAQALPLEKVRALFAEGPEALAARLVAPNDALVDMPALVLDAAQAKFVSHGVPVEAKNARGRVRVLGPDGKLLAIAEGAGGRLRYLRVLV